MQPPRSLAFRVPSKTSYFDIAVQKICEHLEHITIDMEDEKIVSILKAIGYEVFSPSDPETIRMKNENLFHPDFVYKLDEAEAIGGVVISYLPEV